MAAGSFPVGELRVRFRDIPVPELAEADDKVRVSVCARSCPWKIPKISNAPVPKRKQAFKCCGSCICNPIISASCFSMAFYAEQTTSESAYVNIKADGS